MRRIYHPTPQEIAAGCAEIQSRWDERERIQRRVRKPLVRHWYPPLLLDIRHERGQLYYLMGDLRDY